MNILVVGGDTKGAWQMRGVQLGGAIGARVTPSPTPYDWDWAELVVLVKRAAIQWAVEAEAFSHRGRVAWDVLDFWQQPEDNGLSRETLIGQTLQIASFAGATVLIGATRAMAEDLRGIYLSHHCRLGLAPIPPRAKAEIVAYDGTKKYLGAWGSALKRACEALGLRFVVNPEDLRSVDAFVSFRDGRWDGWACRQWKSGVKHVNAIVAGRPMLAQPSAAHRELAPIGQTIESPEALTDALQAVTRREVRDGAYEYGRRVFSMYQLHTVAAQYAGQLRQVARRAA